MLPFSPLPPAQPAAEHFHSRAARGSLQGINSSGSANTVAFLRTRMAALRSEICIAAGRGSTGRASTAWRWFAEPRLSTRTGIKPDLSTLRSAAKADEAAA